MDKKELFETLKTEVSATLSKVFDKVEEVGKVSNLKLKIHGLQAQIKDYKAQIGEIVCNNQDGFKDIPEIKVFLDRIENIEAEIEEKNKIIEDLQEKESTKKEEKTE